MSSLVMTIARRFQALFSGFQERFGQFDLASHTGEGKRTGRALTRNTGATSDDFAAHLAGKTGIGIIPLRSDDTIHFAAIDIDVYPAEQERRGLTHGDVALALMDTPMIVSRSKSNGVHVWLFAATPVPAKLATDYLRAQAAQLGVAGCEVFPKQTTRHSREDVGNWINLPYFGDTRKAVVPNKSGSTISMVEPTVEKFLDIAEAAAKLVDEDYLRAHVALPETQRDTIDESPMWQDGPPCLQALIAGFPERRDGIKRKFDRGEITEDQYNKQLAFTNPQLTEGGRNKAFFNAGHYLRRRLSPHTTDIGATTPEQQGALRRALNEAHVKWRVETGHEGIDREIDIIARQASKGKWGYSCSDEPLKGFCNRRLCLKRRYGVGSSPGEDQLQISGVTIIKGEERQYYMTVGDTRVFVPNVNALLTQREFARLVTNATDDVWLYMKENQYLQMIKTLLQNADVLEPLAGVSDEEEVLHLLRDFVHTRRSSPDKRDDVIHEGRVLWSENGKTARFILAFFIEYMQGKGSRVPKQTAARWLREHGIVSRQEMIGGRRARPYHVTIADLD